MIDHGLQRAFAALRGIGANSSGGIERLAWSAEHRRSLEWLTGRMQDVGLEVTLDPAGNVIGRFGAPRTADAVVVGSHFDTVRSAGLFDGALGVLAGVEAIARLRAAGFTPSRPVWVVAFMDEEGVRFGSAMLGSRAFAGQVVKPDELEITDSDGTTLADAIRRWNLDPARISTADALDSVGAYLELHIEQGPLLTNRELDIGVVTGVVGLLSLRVEISGERNHAGTTPMSARRDALATAARVIVGLQDLARAGEQLATVGEIIVPDAAASIIPGRCHFTVDLRAPSDAALADGKRALAALVDAACEANGTRATIHQEDSFPAVLFDPELVDLVEACAQAEHASSVRMVSGAGHDAMIMAQSVRSAMLFVPSDRGISHAPAEYTRSEQIELGLTVLMRAVEHLAST